MIFLCIPKMDTSKKTPIILFLIVCINSVPGQGIPPPANVSVNIMDGEVLVHWKQPVDAPLNSMYNVEMGNFSGQWTPVETCTKISKTHCDLTKFIRNYERVYKVKVQLVAGEAKSRWIPKKVNPKESDLQPPTFTLLATSSTLTVHVHQKPILMKLFPFGVIYTIYLEEREPDNKTTTAYLTNDMDRLDERTKIFRSLHWGREYCVSMKVEGIAGLSKSSVSPPHCLQLPEQEWFIMAVTSLSFMGVVAILTIVAIVLLCYVRRPEKTPGALKSPASNWSPLSVEAGTMEVVTDKGWFLSSHKKEGQNCVKDPLTLIEVTEDNAEEDRRTSMDSGVSMDPNSATNSGGSPPMRQDDSGIGSLGGAESSTSSQADYSLQDERTDADTGQKREDSGVGLGCPLNISSLNLGGQDSRLLKEPTPRGNYRTQGPCAVEIPVCADKEAFKQILPETALAEVITGYRAGPQSCICSGAGQCTWCHKQGHYGSEGIIQYRPTCIENGLLSSKRNFVDSYKTGLTFSGCSKKSPMDTVMTFNNFGDTFTQLEENFPLLTALSSPPLMEAGHDFNMNDVSLSLCDIQLRTD